MILIWLITFIIAPLMAEAAPPEPQTIDVQTSLEVVKAEFGETIWALRPLGDGVYLLRIRVPNTGTYDAEQVDVAVQTAIAWHYLSSEASIPVETLVKEDQPTKSVHWIVPELAMGKDLTIAAKFSYGHGVESDLPINVTVDSRVSAPVAVQTVSDQNAAAPTTSEPAASDDSPTLWQRLASWAPIVWIGHLLAALAHWLNDLVY